MYCEEVSVDNNFSKKVCDKQHDCHLALSCNILTIISTRHWSSIGYMIQSLWFFINHIERQVLFCRMLSIHIHLTAYGKLCGPKTHHGMNHFTSTMNSMNLRVLASMLDSSTWLDRENIRQWGKDGDLILTDLEIIEAQHIDNILNHSNIEVATIIHHKDVVRILKVNRDPDQIIQGRIRSGHRQGGHHFHQRDHQEVLQQDLDILSNQVWTLVILHQQDTRNAEEREVHLLLNGLIEATTIKGDNSVVQEAGKDLTKEILDLSIAEINHHEVHLQQDLVDHVLVNLYQR